MTQALQPIPENERSPFPEGRLAQLGVALGLIAAMVALLLLMGRHPVCPCGRVTLLQTGHDPNENSQQFADWYSLLHVAFGMGLYAMVRWLRPHWTVGSTMLAVVFGHSIWEVAENTPWIIGVFSGGVNAPHYSGDSILNSLGDSFFAFSGAAAMPFLALPVVAVVVLAIEVAVTWGVGDGFVVGTLRLLGVDV